MSQTSDKFDLYYSVARERTTGCHAARLHDGRYVLYTDKLLPGTPRDHIKAGELVAENTTFVELAFIPSSGIENGYPYSTPEGGEFACAFTPDGEAPDQDPHTIVALVTEIIEDGRALVETFSTTSPVNDRPGSPSEEDRDRIAKLLAGTGVSLFKDPA